MGSAEFSKVANGDASLLSKVEFSVLTSMPPWRAVFDASPACIKVSVIVLSAKRQLRKLAAPLMAEINVVPEKSVKEQSAHTCSSLSGNLYLSQYFARIGLESSIKYHATEILSINGCSCVYLVDELAGVGCWLSQSKVSRVPSAYRLVKVVIKIPQYTHCVPSYPSPCMFTSVI